MCNQGQYSAALPEFTYVAHSFHGVGKQDVSGGRGQNDESDRGPHEEQEHCDPDEAIDQVKQNLMPENRIHPFQLGRSQQRQILVHEDEEGDGKRHIQSCHPAGDFELLALIFIAIAVCGRQFVERRVGGKLEGAESERHRVAQRHYSAHHRPAHPLMLLGRSLQRLAVRDNFSRRLAYSNAPGMRRTHHYALEHSLPSDECFLAALKRGEQLHRRQESQDLPPMSHSQLDVTSRREDSKL